MDQEKEVDLNNGNTLWKYDIKKICRRSVYLSKIMLGVIEIL